MSDEISPQFRESFRAYDIDGDGFITKNDLLVLEARLGRPTGFSELLAEFWKFLIVSMDTNEDGKVALEEWNSAWQGLLELSAANYQDLPAWYRNYCEFLFEILDENGDGRVVQSEYERFLSFFGREALPGVFEALSEHTGHVTREQLQGIVYDLSCVLDDKNVLFWGRPTAERQAS